MMVRHIWVLFIRKLYNSFRDNMLPTGTGGPVGHGGDGRGEVSQPRARLPRRFDL